jgi:hypothetical protein
MSKQRTVESWAIANAKPGTVFYSNKIDRHLTAIATIHKRKIQTERLTAITAWSETPRAFKITKVTIL